MFELAFEAAPRELAVGGAAALSLAWLAWRWGPRGPWTLGARWAALAVLWLSLAEPVLVPYETVVEKPRVAVWLDGSAWMGIEEGGRSRLARAKEWLARAAPGLEERAEVSTFVVRDRPERAPPDGLPADPEGGLRLDRALGAAEGFDRVWLLSAGVGDLSEDLPGALSRARAPVDVLGVGLRRQARGVTLRAVRSPDFAFLHEPFELKAEWEATDLAGRWVRVRLLRDGAPVREELVGVPSSFSAFVSTFSARPERLGSETWRLELEAPGLPPVGEDLRVEVIRQKLRILYLAGRPSFEYAALRQFIKSDPSNELVSFVILRNQENVTPVPEHELSLIPFPAQEIFVERIFDFDLFIFQDFAHWRFGLPSAYLESMRQFVARGGGLLLLGGSNAFGTGGYKGTPIDELLPVVLPAEGAAHEEGLYRPSLGKGEHPLLRFDDAARWDELPPLDGRQRFGPAKPGAVVLASAPDGAPVFAAREFGRGRVFLSSTHSTWRWKLGAGLDWRIGSFYDRYWSRVFDFLTGALDLKRVRFVRTPGERPAARVLVFDESFRPLSGAGLELRLLRDAGGGRWEPLEFRELRPGAFEAGLPPGRHRLKAVAAWQGRPWGEDEATLEWAAPSLRFTPLDEALLRRVAEKTGGRYAPLSETSPSDWLGGLPEPKPVRRVRARRAVWTSGAWLWLLAGLLILEWAARRRAGWA